MEVRVSVTKTQVDPEVNNATSISKRNKTWRLADLPTPSTPAQRVFFVLNWKRIFVTTILSWAGAQLDTFETNSTVIVMAQAAWTLIFPALGPLAKDGLDAVVGNVRCPFFFTIRYLLTFLVS